MEDKLKTNKVKQVIKSKWFLPISGIVILLILVWRIPFIYASLYSDYNASVQYGSASINAMVTSGFVLLVAWLGYRIWRDDFRADSIYAYRLKAINEVVASTFDIMDLSADLVGDFPGDGNHKTEKVKKLQNSCKKIWDIAKQYSIILDEEPVILDHLRYLGSSGGMICAYCEDAADIDSTAIQWTVFWQEAVEINTAIRNRQYSIRDLARERLGIRGVMQSMEPKQSTPLSNGKTDNK